MEDSMELGPVTGVAGPSMDLMVPDPLAIKGEVQVSPKVDPALAEKADQFVNLVLSYDPNDKNKLDVRTQTVASVDGFGSRIQEESAQRGAMLSQPIKDLAAKGADGGPVANALLNLDVELNQLDPGKFDFSPGWFGRLVGQLPGIGSPVQKYFTKYESAQTIIGSIIKSLKDGKEMLKRDNMSLIVDQQDMRALTIRVGEAIKLGMMIDQKLSESLSSDALMDEDRRRYIEEELLFPLRQRIGDLQQQLVVNQQGVIALEVVIRNNKELVKGVDRAVNVTVNALSVAVTVAMALANQKIVLDKIEMVNKTTNNLIAYTARELKTVGTQIHKQASSMALDMNTLKAAFSDVRDAMNEISTYRREALPVMAKTILEMDQLTSEAEKAVKKMELGNRNEITLSLDV
jgi:uncharacterized protein YaaN involved in tellurite resistance